MILKIHSTEGYLNNISYPLSDAFSIKAIELVAANLEKAVKDGNDIDAREGVALGNTIAGMVESTSGCISEHFLAHAMSGIYPDLPHGFALITISAAYYRHCANSGLCDKRMVNMAKAMGKTDAEKTMDFVDALVDLQKACGVDNLKLSDYNIQYEDLNAIVENAWDTMGGLFKVDTAPVTKEDCLRILQESYK